MGRFDVLKGTDTNFKRNENTIKRRRRGGKNKNKNKNNDKINQDIVLKDNVEKDVVVKDVVVKDVVVKDVVEKDVVEKDVVEKDVVEKESEWIQQIKKKKEEKTVDININDPRYWNGPLWKGPMFIRETCLYDKNNISSQNPNVSSFIIPRGKIEYSKNGLDWHDSWDNTFTTYQLESIKKHNEQQDSNELFRRMSELHLRRQRESDQLYEDTGELDHFAWAEEESYKYELYCKKIEEEENRAQQEATEQEDWEGEMNDEYYDY